MLLGKRSQHLIRKFSELLVFGETATALLDTIGSPRSPFEMNSRMQIQSPKFGGGVGLGIVVALDKSEETGYEVVPKQHVCTSPIPIQKHQQNRFCENEILVGSPEDYTYVTYRDESNKPITKVFYDGGEESGILRHDYYTTTTAINDNNNNNNTSKNNNVGVLRRSPPQTQTFLEAEPSFLTLDFLNSCHLCRMNLDGKDIFMYRGEKGFCSMECRSKQIMMDERKEKCRSEASKAMEMSNSSYTTDQMFSTGIMAL